MTREDWKHIGKRALKRFWFSLMVGLTITTLVREIRQINDFLDEE